MTQDTPHKPKQASAAMLLFVPVLFWVPTVRRFSFSLMNVQVRQFQVFSMPLRRKRKEVCFTQGYLREGEVGK